VASVPRVFSLAVALVFPDPGARARSWGQGCPADPLGPSPVIQAVLSLPLAGRSPALDLAGLGPVCDPDSSYLFIPNSVAVSDARGDFLGFPEAGFRVREFFAAFGIGNVRTRHP
jgi:hypothetical protein